MNNAIIRVIELASGAIDPITRELLRLLIDASLNVDWTKEAIARIDKAVQDLINNQFRAGHLFLIQARQAVSETERAARLDDALRAFTKASVHESVPLQASLATVLIGNIYDIRGQDTNALDWYERAYRSYMAYEAKLLDQKPTKGANYFQMVAHHVTMRGSTMLVWEKYFRMEWSLIIELIELHKLMRALCRLLSARGSAIAGLRSPEDNNTRLVYGDLVYYPQLMSGIGDHRSTKHWFIDHFGSRSHKKFPSGFRSNDFIKSMENYPDPESWCI
jgi:tetratricopeptide (TPR) repeat protein